MFAISKFRALGNFSDFAVAGYHGTTFGGWVVFNRRAVFVSQFIGGHPAIRTIIKIHEKIILVAEIFRTFGNDAWRAI